MGGLKKVPSEGGSGGKRAHSGMDHWAYTEEIKNAARVQRRTNDRKNDRKAVRSEEDGSLLGREFRVVKALPVTEHETVVIAEGDFGGWAVGMSSNVEVIPPDHPAFRSITSLEMALKRTEAPITSDAPPEGRGCRESSDRICDPRWRSFISWVLGREKYNG